MLRFSKLAALVAGLVAPLALSAAPKVGEPAPVFSVTDVAGKSVKLDDCKGKVVVLEWFNPDCPYVKKFYVAGKMQALRKDAAAKGVVWLSIYSNSPKRGGYDAAALTQKIAGLKGSAPGLVADSSGDLARLYDAKTTPQMFIIGADGKLLYDGAIDSIRSPDSDAIAKAKPYFADALAAVLAGKPVENAKNKSYGCGLKL